jgi:hypothetical protein
MLHFHGSICALFKTTSTYARLYLCIAFLLLFVAFPAFAFGVGSNQNDRVRNVIISNGENCDDETTIGSSVRGTLKRDDPKTCKLGAGFLYKSYRLVVRQKQRIRVVFDADFADRVELTLERAGLDPFDAEEGERGSGHVETEDEVTPGRYIITIMTISYEAKGGTFTLRVDNVNAK